MSLDVSLIVDIPVSRAKGSGIFVRKDGATVEITIEEWNRENPGVKPVVLLQDDTEETTTVYSDNITHNLNMMAEKASIYHHLWRPDEIGIEKAVDLILPLTQGWTRLRSDPDYYKRFSPENGWGTYEGLLKFVEDYIKACWEYPDAKVHVSR